MSKRVIAPVQLGCCPEPPRCVLCPPPPPEPNPETVAALVERYRVDSDPGDEIWVGFFGGPPPSDAFVRAAGVPSIVRVRPDLLSRADADRLRALDTREIELDALTFSDDALRGIGRRYRSDRLEQMCAVLRAAGTRVGLVLAPGLPGTTYEQCLEDARVAARLAHTVRLHPVQVLADTRLREWHSTGRYEPLTLAQAVTVCHDMMQILEPAGLSVIRVGQQAGQDGLGRAVAGPRHPSLRQLVDGMRVKEHLRDRLKGTPAGTKVVIFCATADETHTRGPFNQHVRDLRAEFGLDDLRVTADGSLPRGRWRIERVMGDT